MGLNPKDFGACHHIPYPGETLPLIPLLLDDRKCAASIAGNGPPKFQELRKVPFHHFGRLHGIRIDCRAEEVSVRNGLIGLRRFTDFRDCRPASCCRSNRRLCSGKREGYGFVEDAHTQIDDDGHRRQDGRPLQEKPPAVGQG